VKQRFQAYRIYETNGNVSSQVEALQLDDLSAGEVTVRVHYSTINYKDAVAAYRKHTMEATRKWRASEAIGLFLSHPVCP
jgi:NADPH:quinone reductase-like Zn-dependent oxidoreductase